jgi:hypothetical protein
MKFNRTNWPYKWFGFWKEYGEGLENQPSAKDFVDETVNKSYEKEKLIEYLGGCEAGIATSLIAFPSPFDGEIITSTPWGGGTLAVRTDGNWVWYDNIGYFIEHNNLVLPDDFYKEIVKRNFLIPVLTAEEAWGTIERVINEMNR